LVPSGAIGTQNVAGPQQPSVKQTVPAGQSADVVHAETHVGTMQTIGPSVVGAQAHPPGHVNVEQLSAGEQTRAPEIAWAETVVTEPTIIGAA
jgi:hypothetical protein